MNPWISAAIAAGAGLVIGVIASRLVRRPISKAPNEAIANAAGPISSLVFSSIFVFGMIVALGFVQPGALDTIPKDLVTFLPRLIAAVIVIIGGNVVSSLARATAASTMKGMGPAERYVPQALRGVILAFAGILAAAQLGVDTTIINIAAAAILFGGAAAMAMLIGLGGRKVAGEVAAGRAWRSALQPGDRIRAQDVNGVEIDGTVVEVNPTNVQVSQGDRTLLVPNSQLLSLVIERSRPSQADE